MRKVASLEAEVSKSRAITHTVAFAKVVKSNHQPSFMVGSALSKLLHTRLDGDELFERCKGLQLEKIDLIGKVEGIAVERDELAKVVAELEAQC